MALQSRLRLPRAGVEKLHVYIDSATPNSVDVQVQGVWHAATVEAPGATLVLRGPAATGTAGVLVTADTPVTVRITTVDEVLVRGIGNVVLVA